TLRKNADECRTHSLAIGCLYPLHFEKDRSGGPSGDATRTVVEKGTKSRGSPRHRQIRLLVLQNLRYEAVLPASDLFAESLAQERRSGRAPREQDGINAWAIVEEFGEVSGYRAVGRIRKSPFPQCRVRPVRPRGRVAEGKKTVQQQTLDFRPHHRRRLRAADHPRPATGQCSNRP